jgi:hypothetical protein
VPLFASSPLRAVTWTPSAAYGSSVSCPPVVAICILLPGSAVVPPDPRHAVVGATGVEGRTATTVTTECPDTGECPDESVIERR